MLTIETKELNISELKRKDGSPIDDGINNNTYNLLFGDYDNLPENEQGSYENINAFATIDCFTKLQEKKAFTKLLKLFYKNTIINLDKIIFMRILNNMNIKIMI